MKTKRHLMYVQELYLSGQNTIRELAQDSRQAFHELRFLFPSLLREAFKVFHGGHQYIVKIL
jgi:hypothetical protein